MKTLPWILIFWPALVGAETVFNGYENFYSMHKNTVFGMKPDGQIDRFYLIADEEGNMESVTARKHAWEGYVDGKFHQLEIDADSGETVFDEKPIKLSEALTFWGDSSSPSDLIGRTRIYIAKNLVCLENSPTGSGHSGRYWAIYLFKIDMKDRFLVKLPSLFASCANVRFTPKGDLAFYHVEYIQGEGEPTGVTFMEYSTNGKGFIAAGNKRHARFVEPGNAFRFAFK